MSDDYFWPTTSRTSRFLYRLEAGDSWAKFDSHRVIIAKADGRILVLSPPDYEVKYLDVIESNIDRDLLVEMGRAP